MAVKSDHILHFYFNKDYPILSHGKGIYLYDTEGKEYIDGSSGAISSSLGHGRLDMAEVLKEQVTKIAFAFRHVSTTDILQELGDKLHEATGMDRFFMVSGGTEATEICTKIARLHFLHSGKPTKTKIISRWQSYHGFSMDSLSWGGNVPRRREYTPYLREDGHIPPPYCYRCWFGKEEGKCNFECANALETEILVRGAENVAAFIAETIVGASLAAVTPPLGYYRRIREICDKYEVLLILDEVMCGSGRTGKMLAADHYGIKPDIVALAKSMGGGYFPVGAASCTEKVVEPIKKFGSFSAGYTWAGNPMAAAVVLKTLEIIEKDNLLENVVQMGDYLKKSLEGMKEKHPTIGDVRGMGLMVGVEFVKNKETRECFASSTGYAGKFVGTAAKMGLIINPNSGFDKGRAGDGTLIGPCFEVTQEEIDKIINLFDKALTSVEKENGY